MGGDSGSPDLEKTIQCCLENSRKTQCTACCVWLLPNVCHGIPIYVHPCVLKAFEELVKEYLQHVGTIYSWGLHYLAHLGKLWLTHLVQIPVNLANLEAQATWLRCYGYGSCCFTSSSTQSRMPFEWALLTSDIKVFEDEVSEREIKNAAHGLFFWKVRGNIPAELLEGALAAAAAVKEGDVEGRERLK
eukprot:5108867-Amphidinium_carterae.2